MKKVLIVLLVLGAGGLLYYILAGNTDLVPSEEVIDENIQLEDVQEQLEETGERKVVSSCNDITNSSNCIDYIGSMWEEYDSAQLNCGEAKIFSTNACPYSEFGGCQMNGESVMEYIAWVYEDGPGGYTPESVADATSACNSLANAKWVTPESILEQN